MKKFIFETHWQVYGISEVEVPDSFTIEQAEEYVGKHFEELPLPEIKDNIDYSWEPDFVNSEFEEDVELEDFVGALPNQFKFISKVNPFCQGVIYYAKRIDEEKSKFLVKWGLETDKSKGAEELSGKWEYTERELYDSINSEEFLIVN